MTLLKRIYCPACGAPVKAEPGTAAFVVECQYCDSSLLVEERRVAEQPQETPQPGATSPPPSALITQESARFELSLLEQLSPGTVADGFSALSLPQERFCLFFLRLADEQGRTLSADYSSYLNTLRASLSGHEDPGLAAFELLEQVSEEVPEFQLEITILLFEPLTSSVLVYNAGGQRSVFWVSGEEGRVIDVFTSYPPLERKMLRMSRDHFSNSKPVFLTASDLVVAVSAAFCGRGGGSYADGTGALVSSLNQHLGEHPLKVVTMAKNAFWTERPPAAAQTPLSGPLRVCAVRARSSHRGESWPQDKLAVAHAQAFEIAYQPAPGDHAELVDLHQERQVFLWFDGRDFTAQEYQIARQSVLELLDRRDYGDNENPRRAGREAAEAVGHGGRFLVLLLLNEYGRTKWYRQGWKQPLGVGPRGLSDPPSAQNFDEGGEASVDEGARQFFPGTLAFFKTPQKVEDLAHCWQGGKASALYGALFAHWRTPNPGLALAKLLGAAQADLPQHEVAGCCLVGRRR